MSFVLWALLGLAAGVAALALGPDAVGRIVLAAERPFREGDRVVVGDAEGRVVGVGLRTTRLRTGDGEVVAIPHRRLLAADVRNADAPDAAARVVTETVLPPDADPAEARRLAQEAAVSSRFVRLDAPVEVALEGAPGNAPGYLLRIRARALDPGDADRLRTEIIEGLHGALRDRYGRPSPG